jgi:gas vesicle protein GvpK
VKKRSKKQRPRVRRANVGRSARGAPAPVTAAELRALRSELERRMRPAASSRQAPSTGSGQGRKTVSHSRRGTAPLRWNPEPDDVQRSVAQLVLTIVEFLRQLMERQAIRRMEQKTLTPKEIEAVGVALMRLEKTVRDIGKRFGLTPEDLNLDLGPLGKLM